MKHFHMLMVKGDNLKCSQEYAWTVHQLKSTQNAWW